MAGDRYPVDAGGSTNSWQIQTQRPNASRPEKSAASGIWPSRSPSSRLVLSRPLLMAACHEAWGSRGSVTCQPNRPASIRRSDSPRHDLQTEPVSAGARTWRRETGFCGQRQTRQIPPRLTTILPL